MRGDAPWLPSCSNVRMRTAGTARSDSQGDAAGYAYLSKFASWRERHEESGCCEAPERHVYATGGPPDPQFIMRGRRTLCGKVIPPP
jgi:hypothetical protein